MSLPSTPNTQAKLFNGTLGWQNNEVPNDGHLEVEPVNYPISPVLLSSLVQLELIDE